MGSEPTGDVSLDEAKKQEWRESVREITAKQDSGIARISQRGWKPGQARTARRSVWQPVCSTNCCTCFTRSQLNPPAVLDDICVIIVSPKIPTNVGVVARACACRRLTFHSSARHDVSAATPLG